MTHQAIKQRKLPEGHDLSVKRMLTLIIQTVWDQATSLAEPDNNQVDITFSNQKALLDGTKPYQNR